MTTPRFSFLDSPPEQAAPLLLGHRLITRDGICLHIVEVEAYAGPGQDEASHAGRGRTERNAPMFGPPGHLYVYLSYGIHRCMNVVAHEPGGAGAVLIRAARISGNLDLAHARRPAAAGRDERLGRGPGRLGQVAGISLADSGSALDGRGVLELLEPEQQVGRISSGRRVGISRAVERPWRWWVTDDPCVSARSRGTAVTRPVARPGWAAERP